jgi:hypothetical protein
VSRHPLGIFVSGVKGRNLTFVGSDKVPNENWFDVGFIEELMQFIGCCPSEWKPRKFLGQVFGNLIVLFTLTYVDCYIDYDDDFDDYDPDEEWYTAKVSSRPEPLEHVRLSQAITEFFQKNHEDTTHCSVLQKRMTELRYKLRVSGLEDFPEFKPILDKISVRVQHAIADDVFIDEFSDENFVFNADLYAGQKLIASLEYGKPEKGTKKYPRHIKIVIKDAQIGMPAIKLATFKEFNTFTICLLEGYTLLSVLQKLMKSLQLEKSTSVVTFAKFLTILFPACAIARHGDEDLAYREGRLCKPQVHWKIFDDTSYAALEGKLVEEYDNNASISIADIDRIMAKDKVIDSRSFIEVAIKRGLLVQAGAKYKLINGTPKGKKQTSHSHNVRTNKKTNFGQQRRPKTESAKTDAFSR